MTLLLHVNANANDYNGLRQLETPAATQSHVPLAHFRVVDLIRTTLGMYGHQIVHEHHGITEDGARYFGLLSLRSGYGNYEDTVGLRNSHDKSFPVGIGFGSRVFVCDNLAFVADHVIKRKHTANLKRDLPGIIGELIEPLALHSEAQHHTIDRYRHTMLTDMQADHAIMGMYREGIINIRRVAEVEKEWQEPTFAAFQGERTAWRLFNGATYALTGRVVERSDATPELSNVIDCI